MAHPEFGPFASAFEKEELDTPGYLILLHLGDGAAAVIDRIEQALTADDPRPWISRFLDEPNWRPHLVAAVAFLLDEKHVLDRAWLWQAIDRGGWVTPQLLVTAYFADGNFAAEAKRRVAAECPVTVPAGLSPLERHSATGPAGTPGRQAKMLASLLRVCAETESLKAWAETMRLTPNLHRLLDKDAAEEDTAGITAEWLETVQELFAKRGQPLKAKTP